jgi:mono/diheme cytochrome c family protein
MRFRISIYIASLALVCGVAPTFADAPAAPARIQFNRDIRPILSQNCFACHGPDKNKRKADLRFDLADGGAFADHKGKLPVVAGNPGRSELMERVTSKDPDKLMPPGDSGKKLTPGQIELLRKWIEQGAKWQPLWSFIPPERPELPAVKDVAWCRNPIDHFILARLEAEGLKPSPEADKARLIRRLYLDLLGLPPTPAELDASLSDTSKDWYEKLVDRLLANPHYGERMALDWLDAARYADTHGYHIDSGRDMTRWREWVIDAFNTDKPFDKFTVEQLAGDLLPNATLDQKIASGFSRNNMVNFEGGAIAEEYHTAYVIDRVNTLGTVWLGLTVGCCQCHDHKFDPISQKEYYQLFAFFNHVSDNGLDGQHGNAGPFIPTPTTAQKKKLDELAAQIDPISKELAAPNAEIDAAQAEWEKSNQSADSELVNWTPLEPTSMKSAGGATLTKEADNAIVVSGKNPKMDAYTIVADTNLSHITAVRLEVLPDDQLASRGPGRSENGNAVLTDLRLKASQPLKIKAASADFSQDNFPIENAIDGNKKTGWAIFPEVGKPHAAIFQLATPLAGDAAQSLTITLEFHSQFAQHQFGKFRLLVTDAANPLGKDAMPTDVRKILVTAADSRTEAQTAALRTYFRTNVSMALKPLTDRLAVLRKEQEEAEATERTTMVMDEMAKPRETFVLLRGQYDKHGDVVSAGVPRSLPPLPAGATNNRLGLAEWLVSPSHPLTARVAVNRYWQAFFGTGIVKTAEDFGSQGEEPSHPALLDWLACEFTNPSDGRTPKWHVKAIVRLIVTSATYRQSSAVTPDLLARDPENRLLARGARMRLPAEYIRDQALAVSGLLNDEIGGRSVSPYQPPGLWEELMSRADGAKWTAQVYTQDHGKDLYRRTMYTFWKRTSPPPSLSTFDAPDRETCTVRRSRTNTPLQALVLMNDPTYVEAARKLAERMMTSAATDADAKIAFAYRLAMSRQPRAEESALLKKIHDQQLDVFEKDPAAGAKLLKVGEAPADPKLDQNELAAWTTVASVILNLDETITKG